LLYSAAIKSTLMTSSVSLSICGDVERPARLALAELRSLMDAELVADFHCREGWSRLGERWRGVRLRTLLALAGAADAAGYVTVGSGEYTAVLTREQAEDERVLLALEHEGAASPDPPASRGWSDHPSGTAFSASSRWTG
jgi:DMSO/TMAO reductase YedYZ molybdopterin-dependent catalytic subunit